MFPEVAGSSPAVRVVAFIYRSGWACGQAQRIYNPPIPCRGLVGSTPTRSAQKQPHKDQIAIHLLYVVRTAYYTASVHQIRAFCVNLSASQFCRKNGIATSGILLCERNTCRQGLYFLIDVLIGL